MTSLIDKARNISKQKKAAEAEMDKLSREKIDLLNRKLEDLVNSILPEIQKIDGESTKHGKFSCKQCVCWGERLRLFCGSVLVATISADIYTYNDYPVDECLEVRTEPRVKAIVYERANWHSKKNVSTYGDEDIADRFINDLASALSELGWV